MPTVDLCRDVDRPLEDRLQATSGATLAANRGCRRHGYHPWLPTAFAEPRRREQCYATGGARGEFGPSHLMVARRVEQRTISSTGTRLKVVSVSDGVIWPRARCWQIRQSSV